MKIFKPYFLSIAALIFISIPTSAKTDPLANILDYQPKCIIETLSPITIDVPTQDYVDMGVPEESQAFKQALHTLRVKATQQGADAISLTSVRNHIMHATKQVSVNYTNSSTQHKRINTRLTTHLEAELFKLCLHDKSLSKQRSKYNSQGYRIETISYSYTMTLPEDQSPASLAKKKLVPAPHISLKTGAYGIELGMATEQVSDRLGPPSIEVNLDNNETSWGYGRSLWFIFSNNRVIEINSRTPTLTVYGKNLIEPRDGFDDIRWLVNGAVPQNATLSDALIELPQARKLVDERILHISNQAAKLQLSFEIFHPKNLSEPVSLLTEYQLRLQSNKGANQKRYASITPTESQLSALFSLLSLSQVNKPSLSQLLQIYPKMSRLNISATGIWWLIGDHLQVQYNDERLSKIKVSPAVFAATQNDTQAPFLQAIIQLGLPTNKQSLLKQYADADDNIDMVDLERDDFYLVAKYESDEANSEIYELEIEYF